MATYLATVQIGRYDGVEPAAARCRRTRVLPAAAARQRSTHDFGRQPEMMATVRATVRALPVRGYTVVVTDDELEIPLEAQGMSIFGAQPPATGDGAPSGWSRTSWRTSGSATA